MKAVWIVDDDQSIRWVLEKALTREAIPCRSFTDPNEVLDALEKVQPALIVSDIRMPRGNGITLLQHLKQDYPHMPVIIMTAFSDMDSAVAAFQGGAYEYITKPFDIEVVMGLIQRALLTVKAPAQVKSIFAQSQNHAHHSSVPELIGQAPAMQEVFRAVGRLTSSNATILITGESGTGKELLARALHRHGARAKAPFMELNLGAMPKELIEGELFGYEKGSFSNNSMSKRGLVELAEGGILFLDEVADMPLALQSSLLQLLEAGKFYRLGANTASQANVHIIAASYQNLENLVAKGLFREDLYHRLNVIRLRLPALRERLEDIPILTQHFLAKSAQQLQIKPKVLLPETILALEKLSFPGNVRQLQSICHWLTVMISAPEIAVGDLPSDLLHAQVLNKSRIMQETLAPENHSEFRSFAEDVPSEVFSKSVSWEKSLGLIAKKMLEEEREHVFQELTNIFEKAVIEAALEVTRGRKVEAAERLGIGRNTITRKLQDLGID